MKSLNRLDFRLQINKGLGTVVLIDGFLNSTEFHMRERLDDFLLETNDFESRYDRMFDYIKLRLKNMLTKEGLLP